MAKEKIKLGQVPNPKGGYYYAPEIKGFESETWALLVDAEQQLATAKKTLHAWLPKFIADNAEKLQKLLAAEKQKKASTTRIEKIITCFAAAQDHLNNNRAFDIQELLKTVEEEWIFYWDALKTWNEEFKKNTQEIRRCISAYEKQWNELKNVQESRVKISLINELKAAFQKIQWEARGNNSISQEMYHGIDILCNDVVSLTQKYSFSAQVGKAALPTKIAAIDSLQNWNQNKNLAHFVNTITAISNAYFDDYEHVPELVEEYFQPQTNIFKKSLLEFPAFKALIDRIPIVQRRIDEKSDWQDISKNQQKKTKLEGLQIIVVDPRFSLIDVYRFMTDVQNKKFITQSTRNDEGCFAFWFRSIPESKTLFEQIIKEIETKFPEVKPKEEAPGLKNE